MALVALVELRPVDRPIQMVIPALQGLTTPMAAHPRMEERAAQAQIVPQQVPEEHPAAVAGHHSFSLAAALPLPNPVAVAVAAHMF
jgi:hypothetical protein